MPGCRVAASSALQRRTLQLGGNGAKAAEPDWLHSKLSISTKPTTDSLSIGTSFLFSPRSARTFPWRSAAAAWIAWASPFAGVALGFEDLVP